MDLSFRFDFARLGLRWKNNIRVHHKEFMCVNLAQGRVRSRVLLKLVKYFLKNSGTALKRRVSKKLSNLLAIYNAPAF
jgi:hypothetical protein